MKIKHRLLSKESQKLKLLLKSYALEGLAVFVQYLCYNSIQLIIFDLLQLLIVYMVKVAVDVLVDKLLMRFE